MDEIGMDEVGMVRDAYGAPRPPTQGEAASARARLAALIDAEGAGPASAQVIEPAGRPRRRLLGGWRLKLGVGLLAAGTAAAAVIVATGQDGPSGKGGPPVAAGGNDFMEVAAKAELLPTGKFWHADEVEGQVYVVRGASGAVYSIYGAQTQSFHYTGADRKGGVGYYDRDVPARPATPADQAAWKQAGSPTSIRVWSSDRYADFSTTRTTPWRFATGEEKGGEFTGPVRGKPLTTKQVSELPTDPAALAKLFFSRKDDDPAMAAGRGKRKPAPGAFEVRLAGGALLNMPLTPKTRAGLMRALAKQPGVHSVGQVVDPLGRKGVALAGEPQTLTVASDYGAPKEEQGTFSERTELVFSPDTGELLSLQSVLAKPGGRYSALKPGAVLDFIAVRSSGWVDTKPKPPAGAPS